MKLLFISVVAVVGSVIVFFPNHSPRGIPRGVPRGFSNTNILLLADGRALSYAVYGPQQFSATVFYLHSVQGSRYEVGSQQVLNDARVRCIVFDRAGNGRSTPSLFKQSNEEVIQDLLALADHLNGVLFMLEVIYSLHCPSSSVWADWLFNWCQCRPCCSAVHPPRSTDGGVNFRWRSSFGSKKRCWVWIQGFFSSLSLWPFVPKVLVQVARFFPWAIIRWKREKNFFIVEFYVFFPTTERCNSTTCVGMQHRSGGPPLVRPSLLSQRRLRFTSSVGWGWFVASYFLIELPLQHIFFSP